MLSRYRKIQRSPDGPFSLVFTKPVELLLLPLVVRLPIPPNVWTFLSFGAKLRAGWLLLTGQFDIGLPLWLAVSLILDGFDGDVARWNEEGSFVGAYLDRGLDRAANCLILSAFFWQLYTSVTFTHFLLLSAPLVIGEIWHETLRVWVSLTGGLLDERDPLPDWDQWIRERGVLLFYAQDSLYFLLGVGLLFFSPFIVCCSLNVVIWVSFIYQFSIHRNEARKQGREGRLLWFHSLRWLLMRLSWLIVFLAVGIGLQLLFEFSFLFILFFLWSEFLGFYLVANWLMSLSANIPEKPQKKERYVEMMQSRDQQFILQGYP